MCLLVFFCGTQNVRSLFLNIFNARNLWVEWGWFEALAQYDAVRAQIPFAPHLIARVNRFKKDFDLCMCLHPLSLPLPAIDRSSFPSPSPFFTPVCALWCDVITDE
jgi:hypothetical protein